MLQDPNFESAVAEYPLWETIIIEDAATGVTLEVNEKLLRLAIEEVDRMRQLVQMEQETEVQQGRSITELIPGEDMRGGKVYIALNKKSSSLDYPPADLRSLQDCVAAWFPVTNEGGPVIVCDGEGAQHILASFKRSLEGDLFL